jgi:hypothetical protein
MGLQDIVVCLRIEGLSCGVFIAKMRFYTAWVGCSQGNPHFGTEPDDFGD